jgi:lipoyl-dependent peroxiredoxin
MPTLKRSSQARWQGDLRGGQGWLKTTSGVLTETPYSFGTRFEQQPGTNPEELIAAAHAGCYAMALSDTMSEAGHEPESVQITATCFLESQPEGGFRITRMDLEVVGRASGLDQAAFEDLAAQADEGCPVSNLLRPGLEIAIEARLET